MRYNHVTIVDSILSKVNTMDSSSSICQKWRKCTRKKPLHFQFFISVSSRRERETLKAFVRAQATDSSLRRQCSTDKVTVPLDISKDLFKTLFIHASANIGIFACIFFKFVGQTLYQCFKW